MFDERRGVLGVFACDMLANAEESKIVPTTAILIIGTFCVRSFAQGNAKIGQQYARLVASVGRSRAIYPEITSYRPVVRNVRGPCERFPDFKILSK